MLLVPAASVGQEGKPSKTDEYHKAVWAKLESLTQGAAIASQKLM